MTNTVKIGLSPNSQAAPGMVAIGGAPGSVVFTFPNGTSLSDIIDLRENFRLAGLIMDAGWDAAAITVRGSVDGSTFFPIFGTDGTEYSLTVVAAHAIRIPVTDLMMFRYLQFRSGTNGAPVNQTATRTMTALAVQ